MNPRQVKITTIAEEGALLCGSLGANEEGLLCDAVVEHNLTASILATKHHEDEVMSSKKRKGSLPPENNRIEEGFLTDAVDKQKCMSLLAAGKHLSEKSKARVCDTVVKAVDIPEL